MILAALLAGAASAQTFSDLVKTHALTASDDYRIGASYVALSGWLHGEAKDPAMVRRVERIARRALDASDRPDLVINVTVADDGEVNASAYPGGFLVVNRGAAELFDDDELTFVLGHEIAHVQLRHYATTENLRIATEKLSVAETAMTSSDREQALKAMDELERMMARYSQQLEFEADLYGLLYAARAGVPVASVTSAMRKLEKATGPIPAGLEDRVHHPDYPARLGELERGAEALRDVRRKFDLGTSALTAGMDELAVDAFQEFLTLFPRSAAGWTNLAAAHLRQGLRASDDPWMDRVPVRSLADVEVRAGGELHMDRAKGACARALAVDPNAPECLQMLGVMARLDADPAAARAFYERAEALRVARQEPADVGLLVNRGILEASTGDAAAAEAFWKAAEELESGEPWARANRAIARERSGDRDAAVALWKALLAEGRLIAEARSALQRLEVPIAPARTAPTAVALGPLSVGSSANAIRDALGEPEIEDADDAGLRVFWMWPSKGVSALLYADAARGFECWGPCAHGVNGVKVGSPWGLVREKLGVPTEEHADPLLGTGRSAFYQGMGLTVVERGQRVARLALWQ